MNTRESIDAIITRAYATLTPSQQRLATYVLDDLPETAMLTSKALAQQLDVSEATVVRFAQQLGFSGYPEFRSAMQKQLLRFIRSADRMSIALETSEDDDSAPLGRIVNATARQLETLVRDVSEQAIAEVTETLVKAGKVYIFGEGAVAGVTVHLGFWLNRLGCDVITVNQTGRRFFDAVFRASGDDAGLIFSFRRIGPEASALIEHLHQQGDTPVLITDVINSSMHEKARQVLLVPRGPMDTFRPMGVLVALADALILAVLMARGDAAVDQLRKLDDLRQRFGFM